MKHDSLHFAIQDSEAETDIVGHVLRGYVGSNALLLL